MLLPWLLATAVVLVHGAVVPLLLVPTETGLHNLTVSEEGLVRGGSRKGRGCWRVSGCRCCGSPLVATGQPPHGVLAPPRARHLHVAPVWHVRKSCTSLGSQWCVMFRVWWRAHGSRGGSSYVAPVDVTTFEGQSCSLQHPRTHERRAPPSHTRACGLAGSPCERFTIQLQCACMHGPFEVGAVGRGALGGWPPP